MGTLDTPLKRGRRSTILRDKKRGLCAGEVTESELTRLFLEFRLASGILAEPSPCKLRFLMIIVRPKGSLKPRLHKGTCIRYEPGWVFLWGLH